MVSQLLAKSAQGASLLILLQVASRASTFAVNQVLLRFLSVEVLGLATQLELFSISTLYFSRESIRVALQRQGIDNAADVKTADGGQTKSCDKAPDSENMNREAAQLAVNLSFGSMAIGLPLTLVVRWLYLRSASIAILSIPHLRRSMDIYAIATVLELFHEPFFALAQQQMLYGSRASAEMIATSIRCAVTCTSAIVLSRVDADVGVLPFALGQISYAIMLNIGYAYQLLPVLSSKAIALFPRRSVITGAILPTSLLRLAAVLYGQSVFKQLLTSGDGYLVAAFTSLEAQGAYALASNYGGLIARIILQPVEESSRSLLACLLLQRVPDRKAVNAQQPTAQAKTYLSTILRLYSLFSLFLVTIAPPLTPILLNFLAGPRWASTAAPAVLAAYCYYIPLLAVNGLLEAYVSSVASPDQLRTQSIWMVGFSILFAATSYVLLGLYDLGAQGLVLANAFVMLGRIAWSWRFVDQDLKQRSTHLDIRSILPRPESVGLAVAAMALLVNIIPPVSTMTLPMTIGAVAIAALSGLVVLLLERAFLYECYVMLRPSSPAEKSSSGS